MLICSNNKSTRNGSWCKNVTAQWFSITNEMRVRNQSNQLRANENPPYFIHKIKTIACEVIGVNVFHRKLMRIHHKKRPITCLLYYYNSKNDKHHYSHPMVFLNPRTYKQSGTPTPTVVQDEALSCNPRWGLSWPFFFTQSYKLWKTTEIKTWTLLHEIFAILCFETL